MKRSKVIAGFLFVVGFGACASLPSYWKFNENEDIYPDRDIHWVTLQLPEYAQHCRIASDACAIRCPVISIDNKKPACRTSFQALPPNRWRCVIVSKFTEDQAKLLTDPYGLPVNQHERKHCKGWDHGY